MKDKIELLVAGVTGAFLCVAICMFSVGCFLASLNWVTNLLEEMMR